MTNLWFWDIVYFSIFSWLVLGQKLYKHQCLCLIILTVISAIFLYYNHKDVSFVDICILFYI